MFFEGQIVEFLDSDQLKMGYVRKQERDRLHVVDPRGRHISAHAERVLVVHQRTSEDDFPARARDLSEKIQTRQSEIDVELLWESLGGGEREVDATELAGLFFSEESPEAVSAVFRALSEDTLFFKRKGIRFLSKTEDQVSAERTRRGRQQEREESRERLTETLAGLIRNKQAPVADLDPILDRVQDWLRHKSGGDIGRILEHLTSAAKAREAAYGILLRAGRVDPQQDPFLAMAGVEERFPESATAAAAALAPYGNDPERTDCSHFPAITIDDEDTREVDDAITLQETGDEIVVGIHIADVSAFVEKGDALDAEAAKRSSTIYLPATTVLMLPERLSTDLASLRHDGLRPAFTVEVRFDRGFNRLGYRIYPSSIRVSERLSYDDANERIERGDPWFATLHALAAHLQRLRAARGAITFRRPELKIHLHDGKIQVRKIDPKSPSRMLVSELMVLANGLAADFAAVNALPVIFRTQEAREAAAVEEAPAIEAIAFERLRKTFKRSRLSLSPGAHSGLGLTAYTQISSPLRRYADLATQRQVTAFLRGRPIPHGAEELQQIAASAEAAESEVRSIEDRSTHYWLLKYLEEESMGRTLNAIVLDRKNNVELEDYYLRAKLSDATDKEPGATIAVTIASVKPLQGEIRIQRA